jgi:CheY-like chemotaxis protein
LGHQIARRAIGAEVSGAVAVQGSARTLARSAVVAVMPAAQRRGVRIELDDQRAGPALLGQAAAIQQVLTNLLLNAIDLSPDATVVELGVEERTDVVAFRISDCGPGIAAEREDDLFEGVPSTRSGGAGIGLRHSRALAVAAGGELELISGQPHAVFELTWPIAEVASRPHGSAPPASSLLGTCVLVIEDDAAVRALIELALDGRGVRTVIVGSAEEYRAVLETQTHFDAALIDLSPIMEEVSDALARLHAHSPGVRTILISGIASAVPDDVAVQVAAWVRKPFEMSEVIDALDRCLHKNPD